jgi:hypothetical protein
MINEDSRTFEVDAVEDDEIDAYAAGEIQVAWDANIDQYDAYEPDVNGPALSDDIPF